MAKLIIRPGDHAIERMLRSHHMQEIYPSSFHYCAYLKGYFSAKLWDEKYLEEVLLRRGFLVRLTDEGLLYSAGNTVEDLKFLEKYSSMKDFLIHRNCKKFPYRLQFDCFEKEKIDDMIFSAVSSGFGLSFRKPLDPFKDFKRSTYGFRLDLVPLNIGIASFVKALSLASVKTCYSCDGHDDEYPEIELLNTVHGEWFLYMLKFFLAGRRSLKRQR